MKGKVYKSFVRSTTLYGSETWCLREKEIAILRTKKAMNRAMSDVKLLDRRNIEELMDMLCIEECFRRMAKASCMRWSSPVLRKEDENVLVKALKFEMAGRRGSRRTNKIKVENTSKWHVIEQNGEV